MAVIGPVWVNGSFFGLVYIMLGLDSADFWVGSGGFRFINNVTQVRFQNFRFHFQLLDFPVSIIRQVKGGFPVMVETTRKPAASTR